MAVTLSNYTELLNAGKIKESAISMAGKPSPDTSAMVCPDCRQEIRETLTGCREIDGRFYCSDCYYTKLGEWIDTHPIGVSRAPR